MATMTSAVKSSWPEATGLREADEDGALAALPLDAQVGELVLERGADGVGGALLEVGAALLAGAVGVLGLGDDDAEVDVGQRVERVAVGDGPVDVGAAAGELVDERGAEQVAAAAGLGELVVADLDAASGVSRSSSMVGGVARRGGWSR